jgi:gliding motility-associated-like protein
VITLANPIPPGNYTISMHSDTNGINLLDNCDRSIPDAASLPVTVYAVTPTPMDSLVKVNCSPDELQLVFSKPMLCSSVTAAGTEFSISGPAGVSVISAAGNDCNSSELSNIIKVKLSAPIQLGGTYRITLNSGTDGNTVYNECGKETPAGSFIDFYVADTVSAVFNYQVKLGCKIDTINFSHDGRNGVNNWQWSFDGNITSSKKDTSITYSVFGNKTATLTVTNGTCSSTFSISNILLDNELNASFESTADVCPNDPANFLDKSYNRVVAWQWDFGNGFTSTSKTPAPQFYTSSNNDRNVPVRLVVQNDLGCKDTAINMLHVVGNCYIAIPKAFTPNSDGLNDYLYPTNAYKARNLKFVVYNRGGQKLFETTNWTNKWDGTFKGQPQDPGTYVWTLVYTHIETGQRFDLKGTTVLIR